VSTASAASLDSIGDVQWFSFVAPAYAGGSWQVTASASNSSMLSPKVMVYDAAGGLLAQASDPSKWSADATASLGSIVPGRRYYAAVTGATNDVFAVGSYSLTVAMSQAPGPVAPPVVPPTPPAAVIPSAPPPAAVPPNTVIPPSGPIYPTVVTISPDRFELNNSISTATRIGRVTQVSIPGLTLPAGDVDFFSFQAGAQGVVQVSAAGAIIQVLNNRGRVVAQGTDSVGVSAARNAALVVRLQAVGTSSVADSTLSISQAASARRTGFGRPTFGRPTFGRPRGRQAALPRPHALYAFEAPVWATSLKSAAV
jgi:hypothetical protein